MTQLGARVALRVAAQATIGLVTTPEPVPGDIDVLRAALIAERAARQQAEARASGAEAMVAHLKLLIAKLKRDRFGQSAERGRHLLDQLELQLEELEASATEDEIAAEAASASSPTVVHGFARNKPVRAPLPAHLAGWTGILQADAYAGFGELYEAKRRPAPIVEASCWSHGRRKFFELADLKKGAAGDRGDRPHRRDLRD